MSLLENKISIAEDISLAISIWKNILLESYSEEIEYIYVKGSALKNWDSNIDYVPQISDIDIHIKVKNEEKSNLLHQTIDSSGKFGLEYRKRFENFIRNSNSKSFHLPRIQIVFINKISSSFPFVYSRLQDVQLLFGNPHFPSEISYEKFRQIDLSALINLKSTLDMVPIDLLDRSDPFEYYTLLRRITYIVSPAPVRLLTQLLKNENPYDIWKWNRTKIVQELKTLSLFHIAKFYEVYYLKAWDLYKNDFKNAELFVEVLISGWQLLNQVYNKALELPR